MILGNDTSNNAMPLAGLTVIDCGSVVAGPTIAMILGDFGAEPSDARARAHRASVGPRDTRRKRPSVILDVSLRQLR